MVRSRGENEEQNFGIEIVLLSIEEPIRQMAINAGLSPDLILDSVKNTEEDNMGWDFAAKGLVEMYAAGIIDPAKVTCIALQNAASVASLLLTTNYAIVDG